MSCNCKLYQKKLDKLQNKYVTLRKNHKKLLGVALLLTDALEEFLKGEKKSKINDILLVCSSLYPDLFDTGSPGNQETENSKDSSNGDPNEISEDIVNILETATESEKEYYEGFMARPRIPRTPQV